MPVAARHLTPPPDGVSPGSRYLHAKTPTFLRGLERAPRVADVTPRKRKTIPPGKSFGNLPPVGWTRGCPRAKGNTPSASVQAWRTASLLCTQPLPGRPRRQEPGQGVSSRRPHPSPEGFPPPLTRPALRLVFTWNATPWRPRPSCQVGALLNGNCVAKRGSLPSTTTARVLRETATDFWRARWVQTDVRFLKANPISESC